MRVWRICRARHAATAFSGEGARRFSGRWHPAGVSLVYTSLSLSLAALETFVHLDPLVAPNDLVSVAAVLPIRVEDCERLDTDALPADWHRSNHPKLQELGVVWARSQRSLALLVPSAVVHDEWNVLVNPAHPDIIKVKLETSKPFHFDARMFR